MPRKATTKIKKKPPAKTKTAAVEEKEAPVPGARARFILGIGRRKCAVAEVRIWPQKGHFLVNGKSVAEFSPMIELQDIVRSPLVELGLVDKLSVEARVRGGGARGQAGAVRLGLSRALVEYQPRARVHLKALGFLTRDSRVKERMKYGLKKARKAPQWQKR